MFDGNTGSCPVHLSPSIAGGGVGFFEALQARLLNGQAHDFGLASQVCHGRLQCLGVR